MKIDSKLLFILCYECGLNKINNCDHDELERSLISVWTKPELKLALDWGYKILDLYEIWHFEKTSKVLKEGLFANFINDMIKGKVEASGWPKEGMTDAEKSDFVSRYEKIEGIKLNPDNIEFNPGKRFIFKICVNSS